MTAALMRWRAAALLLVVVLLALGGSPTWAQTEPSAPPPSATTNAEPATTSSAAAPHAGSATTAPVAAAEPATTEPAAEPGDNPESLETAAATAASALETAIAVRFAIVDTLSELPDTPDAIVDAARGSGRSGTLQWFGWTVPLAAVAILASGIVCTLLRLWGNRVLGRLEARAETVPAFRTSYVMLRTALRYLADLAFLGVGILAIILIVPSPGPARMTTIVVLIALTMYLLFRDFFVSLFLPRKPAARLLALDDATARRMQRTLLLMTAVSVALLGFSIWLNGIHLPEKNHDVVRMISSLTSSVLLGLYFVIYRVEIGGLIRGAPDYPTNGVRKFFAATWLFLIITYLVIASALTVTNIVLSEGFRAGPVLVPIVSGLAGLTLYGIAVIVLARRFAAHQARLLSETTIEPEIDEATGEPKAPIAVVEPVTVWRMRWHGLFQNLAGIGSVVIAVVTMFVIWGRLEITDEGSEWLGLILFLLGAYAFYASVRTWIDGKLEDELPGGEGDPEEGMGPGSSRLATLLPLLRNVVFVTVATVSGMVLLAALGLNVGPLFASAGVIGLAVGFGAQTLIRDMFSGAFFLIDDAFRRGEYIDVGGAKGSVEKISLRSFQLRHHNGPLHTIPFGAIKQLTNYSRDWVVMKLPLRIVYGTDIERVRKLVKKLGQELSEDPEVGPLFLAPLKSQGVVEMDDSAMIMRVKFMTEPGNQFIARRHVLARISELFDKEGIRFAHREVTVRIADADRYSPEIVQEAAAAGAARAVEGQTRL
ncbi:mechanosensitive ion channel [Acuticoccus sp. M5D2P5]|uniref:mechanosensitive ion channel family protein n=1 Tax=Acuticoccus kalidii TaxID=2910977 RepID=UPI001F2A4FAB|nr:mechanosensitive ion channel family protein [Acuticoccus kalidii]MCF3935262.1 mechanosensitive ion channel [Acuticoccus kalidii]